MIILIQRSHCQIGCTVHYLESTLLEKPFLRCLDILHFGIHLYAGQRSEGQYFE